MVSSTVALVGESKRPEPRPGYALKKLRKAQVILSTSSGPLRRRLGTAWVDQGQKADGAIPPGELADRYDLLHATLCSSSRVGSIRASIDELSDKEVRAAAEELNALTLALAVAVAGDAEVVPGG